MTDKITPLDPHGMKSALSQLKKSMEDQKELARMNATLRRAFFVQLKLEGFLHKDAVYLAGKYNPFQVNG